MIAAGSGMKFRLMQGVFLLFLAVALPAAFEQDQPYGRLQEDPKFPNGKSQRDEILKAEREDNIRDAARLIDIATALKADLEKTDRNVLSMDTLKKTDDIQKLVKKVHDRLRHY
jgi:hypothetical protein